jgi:hypothetical protein
MTGAKAFSFRSLGKAAFLLLIMTETGRRANLDRNPGVRVHSSQGPVQRRTRELFAGE